MAGLRELLMNHYVDQLLANGNMQGNAQRALIAREYGVELVDLLAGFGDAVTSTRGHLEAFDLSIADAAFTYALGEQNRAAISKFSEKLRAENLPPLTEAEIEYLLGLSLEMFEETVRTGIKFNPDNDVYDIQIHHCFPAGTKIRLADGSEKAIEHISTNDKVASFHPEHFAGRGGHYAPHAGGLEGQRVVRLFENITDIKLKQRLNLVKRKRAA